MRNIHFEREHIHSVWQGGEVDYRLLTLDGVGGRITESQKVHIM